MLRIYEIGEGQRFRSLVAIPSYGIAGSRRYGDDIIHPQLVFGNQNRMPNSLPGCRPHADGEDKLRRLTQQVELEDDLLERYPPQLSGGQKQRVVIARALATSPQLIICDEPTSALDPLIAAGILQLLLRLQEERGMSYLFITHDIAVVRAIADDIIVMHNGKAVAVGSRDSVLSPPHDDYTDLLLSSVPEMRPGWLEDALTARKMESGGE